MSIILATSEAEISRILVRVQPWQIVYKTLISKITRAKWTEGMDQAVEHLYYEYRALSSNSSPINK
jgi:hypothetical protein